MKPFALSIVMLLLAVPALAGVNMKPGMWEITSQMEMPGLPIAMPASTYTQCIGTDDLVPKDAKQGQSGDHSCTIVSQKIEGNDVEWVIVCDNPDGKMTSKGKISYQGTSFKGTTITTGAGIQGQLTTKMEGKRIGECK